MGGIPPHAQKLGSFCIFNETERMHAKLGNYVEDCIFNEVGALCASRFLILRSDAHLLPTILTVPLKHLNIERSNSQMAEFKNFIPPFPNEPDYYRKYRNDHERKRNELLVHPDRFQRINQRQDRSDWPAEANRCISKGNILLPRL